jgi:hypothetical protein
MNVLFEFGEALLCMGPVFMVIALVALGLLLNSLPKRKSPTENDDTPATNEDRS